MKIALSLGVGLIWLSIAVCGAWLGIVKCLDGLPAVFLSIIGMVGFGVCSWHAIEKAEE